jgi:uncharacterized protein (TIGR03435 family)
MAQAGRVSFAMSSEFPGIKGSMIMAKLAHFVSVELKVPVQDLTGLDGKYDIDVAWMSDRAIDSPDGGSTGPFLSGATGDIFYSFQKSLGPGAE